jgi:hypothetical protein
MKKILHLVTLSVLLCFATAAFSQDKISASSLTFRAKAGSAVEYLSKEKTYKVVPPSEPTPAKGEIKRFLSFNQSLGLDAKRIKGDEKVDKTFEIITDGIKSLDRYQDEPFTDSLGSGFIRRLYFTFPLRVIVRNAAGEIERELILLDQSNELSGVFHANMLAQTTLVEGQRPVVSFKSEEQLSREYESNKQAIFKRLERNQTRLLQAKVERVVNAAYGYNKFPLGMLYCYTPEKGSGNADLETQCNQLKVSLAQLSDKAKETEAMANLEVSYQYFKKELESKNIPNQLLLGNGALAAITTGHLAEANDWFSKYVVNYFDSRKNKVEDFVMLYQALFEVYAPYFEIKQSSQNPQKLNLKLTAFDDKRKHDEKIALKKKRLQDSLTAATMLTIYNGDQGTVVLKEAQNGITSLSGKVYYDFNKTTTEVNGKTVSTQLRIVTANGDVYLRPRQISNFSVGNKRYYVLDFHTSGNPLLGAAVAIATGDLTENSFWEILQEDEKVSFFELPGGNTFAVKLETDKQAYSIEDIVKNKKPAQGFLATCPTLAEAVGKKEIKSVESRDDFKKFYQWLQANCK